MKLPQYYRGEFDSWIANLYDIGFKIAAFGKSDSFRKIIAKKISKKSKKILDMTTGTGAVAIETKKEIPKAEVIGIDLSDRMLSIAKRKALKNKTKIKFLQRNIEHTGFKANYFDAVTISFGLHELPEKNRLNAVKEAHKILKKKGTFIIMDFDMPGNTFSKLLMKLYLRVFEPEYSKTVLKEGLIKGLKINNFHNIKKDRYFSGAIQTVCGIK
mgnify:CR=1 FL=1|jgi:demethylmenaquinone methyltransferase/2-methoxy-6-polyprenyl-1,4-benzoquinol methylase|tara:strand:- start:605 stop:1246 length:642 start_codon:yes stop_codon:yes gene_type:complete